MEYLEVIETVIPFVIKRILLGVEDKIYGGLEVSTSATYAVDLAYNMMYQKCFDPYFQNQKDNEDLEATSTQKERFRSYDIKDMPPQVLKQTAKIEQPPLHQFMMPTQLWDSYQPELVKQPIKEYIEEYPNERRIMEQKCFEKQNKEQMLRERSREKRQMKEQYTRLIQAIGTKDYTFDYNCDPLAQSNNQTKREMYQKLPFDVPLNEGNQIIHKPKLVEQIKQKRRQAENEETVIEFLELQTQEMKLQPGVKLNLIPIFPKEMLQRQMTSQSKEVGTPQMQMPMPKKKYKNMVRLNDLYLAGQLQYDAEVNLENILMQNTKTSAITPTNRSMFDQQILKQDVPKLPKLRSHSINARTKQKSRTQQTYSIITYRE